MDRIEIRKDTYFDSVFLMAASAELGRTPGLLSGYVVLATDQNRDLLAAQGFDPARLEGLGATDLVIALRADDETALEQAAARAGALLSTGARAVSSGSGEQRPVGLDGGLAALPDANLALISVPGEYAAFEAHKALTRGLHVMLFSNNVSLEDEVALKERASKLGLLVMGPDCGTALVGGLPLGFANRVRPGRLGLVGASGTGLQEVSCQLHRLGSGVTHILGTGGRDLKSAVGARTMLAAIQMLARDPETRALVVVSKPPAREVAERVLSTLAGLDKPSVVCFLGDAETDSGSEKVHRAGSLAEAAWLAHCLASGKDPTSTFRHEPMRVDGPGLVARMAPQQRWLWGLFTGGTLGGEALSILRRNLGPERVRSNLAPPDPEPTGESHTVLDLGDDVYTRGRPHPMIDPTPRGERIVERGADPRTAVLLLDVVLGHGSHPDPGGAAAEAVAAARRANPGLVVLASITGTDQDPQGLDGQRAALERAGVQVLPSNAAAATIAVRLIEGIEKRRAERSNP